MSKNEKDMGTPKIIAIKNRDVSNAQVTTWQTNATEKKDVSSEVCMHSFLQGFAST
jgi:hypothetical protein